MALPVPIQSTQTDSKSPVDDTLMDGIRQDLDDLDGRFAFQKTFDYEFKINGLLSGFTNAEKRKLDGALVASAQTFSRARVYIDKPGNGGTLEIDIRKYKRPDSKIIEIARQYAANISSVTQIVPALATQSVERLVAFSATQSIQKFLPAVNIQSIVVLEPNSVKDDLGNVCANPVRYNFSAALSPYFQSGKSVTIAGCTNAANDGYFPYVYAVNLDGYPCLVVDNAAGVNQTSAAGTADRDLWEYTFSNPVDTDAYVVGEFAKFSGHTDPNNNSSRLVIAVNSGGNNLIVNNPSGVAQAAPAGQADTRRFKYVFSTPATADFVAGENAYFSGHTSAFNNGSKPLKFVNYGGNDNLVVYDSSGSMVTQGAPAGQADTLRYIVALSSDPAGQVLAGDEIVIKNTTSGYHNGLYAIKEVKRSGSNNVVILEASSGYDQPGAAGTIETVKTLIKFATDQSAFYTLGSRVELENTASENNSRDWQLIYPNDSAFTGDFIVSEINRGGGANYNIVVRIYSGEAQASPAGRVKLESRSIFSTKPSIALPKFGTDSYARDMRYVVSTAFNAEAAVVLGDLLGAEITQSPTGDAANVVIQLV